MDEYYEITRYNVQLYTDAINAVHGVYYETYEYFIPQEICKEYKLTTGICFNYADRLTIFLTDKPRHTNKLITVKFPKKDIGEIINIFILDSELVKRKEKIIKLIQSKY